MTREDLQPGILRDIFDYWTGLGSGGSSPSWLQVEPAAMPRRALPYLVAIERLPDGDFYYRLSGTQVDALIGRVAQGKRLSELPLDRGAELTAAFQAVLDRQEPRLLHYAITTAAYRFRETWRIALPMRAPDGAATMIFGAIQYGLPDR